MAIENRRQLVLIVFAVAAGIIASVFTANYVQKSIETRTAQLAEDYETKQKEIVAQIRQDSDQKMGALAKELDRAKAEQNDVIKKQLASLQQQMATKAAVTSSAPAERKRSKIFLAVKTPEGKRAVTVMIDSLSAVGGLLNAGDFVDVIAHLDMPLPGAVGADSKKSPTNKTVTAMVFQDLEVLAINTNLDEPGYYAEQQAAQTLKVTVAVDPDEAGLLAFADKNGKLSLALRSPNERDKQTVKTSTWKTLADYILQNQGSSIGVSEPEVPVETTQRNDVPEEYRAPVRIFKGGKEI